MNNLLKLMCLAGLAVLMTGCSSYDYYQVESNFKMSAANDRIPATITKGQGFEANFPRIATIAVKAPDFCVSESQSQRTGTARAETNVMQTTCGVEMAQIESSLAKAGFGVISWKVLQNEMTVSTSHLDAAKKLKADAMFQINSLERGVTQAGQDARWDRRFYITSGGSKVPTAVDSYMANLLDTYAKQNEQAMIAGIEVLSASINASVTLVENGRAIWFYEWNNVQSQEDADQIVANTYVYCIDGYCQPYTPQEYAAYNDQLVQGTSDAVSIGAKAADRRRAVHDKLMKQVVEDMVGRFTL